MAFLKKYWWVILAIIIIAITAYLIWKRKQTSTTPNLTGDEKVDLVQVPFEGSKYTLGNPSIHSFDDLVKYGVYEFKNGKIHRISSLSEWSGKGYGSAYEMIPLNSSSTINGWIAKYGLV